MSDLVKRLRHADEYEPLGHDAWEAADRIEELEAALRDLVDDEPCRYDHHGYCQAHFVTSPCEMAIARKVLDTA